jgi:hypothetical protein
MGASPMAQSIAHGGGWIEALDAPPKHSGKRALQIYAVPSKVAYQTTSSSINTNIALAPSRYSVVVEEWSNSGSYLKETVNITVQDNAPTVTISSPAPGATVILVVPQCTVGSGSGAATAEAENCSFRPRITGHIRRRQFKNCPASRSAHVSESAIVRRAVKSPAIGS